MPPKRMRSQRRVPIEFVRANPRNPRKLFSEAELEELSASIRERGIIQPIVVRSRGAGHLRDHRRRAALARGAARRPARSADRRDRGDRRRSARTRDHRERAARRSQSAGRSDRLSGARRRVRSFAGRHREDRRQEPQPRRQHAAAAEAAGHREGLHQRRQAFGRSRARADQSARSGSRGARDRRPRASTCARSRRSARRRPRPPARRAKTRARVVKDADTVALEKRLSDALGLVVGIDHRGKGGVLHVRYRTLEQLDDVIRRLEK